MRLAIVVLCAAWVPCMIAAARAQHADSASAPPPSGAVLFENRCARCHGVAGDGDGGLGPSLVGVVGRPAASRPDFLYSAALKARGGIWTRALLDRYLADPQAFAPGAEMDVNSPDPAERAAIIDHVETLK